MTRCQVSTNGRACRLAMGKFSSNLISNMTNSFKWRLSSSSEDIFFYTPSFAPVSWFSTPLGFQHANYNGLKGLLMFESLRDRFHSRYEVIFLYSTCVIFFAGNSVHDLGFTIENKTNQFFGATLRTSKEKGIVVVSIHPSRSTCVFAQWREAPPKDNGSFILNAILISVASLVSTSRSQKLNTTLAVGSCNAKPWFILVHQTLIWIFVFDHLRFALFMFDSSIF